ncbi:alpha-tubulin suppressor-like RCC1 family protein, partial [Paenibacillus barcinonensis]
MRGIYSRNFTIIFIIGIIFYFGVFNFLGVTNEAYAATNVWAEKSKVEFGESIKIHYNFDDREHAVKINIFRNGNMIDTRFNFDTSISNILNYSSYNEEGAYKFEIIPLDVSGYSEQVIVKVFKHRVIFIPGIMGSELYSGSTKLWIPGGNPLNKIPKLEMDRNGDSVDRSIYAGAPEDEFYKTIHDYLNKKFFVIDFGYDWRLGANKNAKLLKDKVTAAKASSPDSKIYLVAHSMGGIIATEYINLGNGSNVDKLVTIGTPYLGAPKAAYTFETGNATGSQWKDGAVGFQIKAIMPNILSAYELLPSRKYFSLNNTYYLTHSLEYLSSGKRSDNRLIQKFKDYESTKKQLESRPWSNDTMLENADKLHKNLNIINNLNSVDSYYIIGDKISTLGEMRTYSVQQSLNDLRVIQGDGTVPTISASVGKSLVPSKTYYIQEEHTKLPGNVNVQKQVENILLGNPGQLAPNIRKFTETTKTLKLKIESPVDLNVYDNSGNHLGFGETGELEENIPFASFYTDGETKIALLNDGDYNVKLQGTGYGDMIYSLVWSNEQDEEVRTVRFDEIAVTPNTVFTSGTNSNGEIELRIDENGDGNIDSTITPSVDLNAAGTQDEIKPTISSAMLGVKGVNEWYGKDAAYKLTGKDDESGIYKVFYSLDDSDFKEYTDPIKLPETGIYKFKSFARDKNRNDSDVLEETIKVDTTNPSNPKMVVEPLKWTNKFVSVTLLDAEDKDSGFQIYQYKIGENSKWINYKEPVIISNEGLHKVFARTLDNVFNSSEVVSGEAKVDKTPPSKPTGFKTVVRDINQLKISWESSTDNVEVVGYDVYLNSTYLTNVRDSEYTFTNLTKGTSYSIKIVARDEAENSSEDGLYYESTPSNLISTRTNHTIRMKTDGTVWSWGNNANGQLGDGTTTNKTTAVQVEGLNDILTVAAGDTYSLALKRDGTVWSWGGNVNGELGTGDTKTSLVPVQIPGLKGIVGLASGWDASYALKRDGTVWSWGANNFGQLGDRTSDRRLIPAQVPYISGVSALSAGSGFALALKSDGTVWGWGNASSNQLGNKGQVQTVWKAEMIAGLSNIKGIEAGRSAGLALTANGDLYRWGSAGLDNVPTPSKWQVGVKAMSGGSGTTQVVKNDGSLWVLGHNAYGELGLGHTQAMTSLIQNRNMSNVVATAGGFNATFAMKSDGSVWSFGQNDKGQLGDGTVTSRMVPVKVLDNVAPQIKLGYPTGSQGTPQVANISHPSIMWTQTDAELTVFAAYQVQILNEAGQVIVDTDVINQAVTAAINSWTVDQELPVGVPLKVQVRVKDESAWSNWSEVGWMTIGEEGNTGTIEAHMSTSTSHSVLVKPDGSVWSWGNNANGQLGDGTTTNKTTAVQVEGLNDILTVAAGDTYSLALKRDGTVWSWGGNVNGELGTGDTKTSLVPVQIPGLKGIVGLASGWDASYALKRDGTVWSWGANNFGQLGDRTSDRRLIPAQVPYISGVSALSAGSGFALALKSDGTVWGWGNASSNQLGNKGQVQTVWKAEMIAGLSNIKGIEAGRSAGLALTANGDLYRWGSAGLDNVPTPSKWQVGVKAMSGGSGTTQVVKNDGSLWVLGHNAYGELGLGHTQAMTSLIQNRNMSNVVA